MADKNVNINLTVQDGTAPGLKKATANVEKASKQMGKSTRAFVTEESGQKMQRFNESTEKMRQVITAVGGPGGAMSQMAGQAVYMGGTLTYMFGRFSLVEAAVFGAGLVIGLFGNQLTKLIPKTKDWSKEIDELKKKHKELTEGVREATQAEIDRLAGITEAEKKKRDLNISHSKLDSSLTAMIDKVVLHTREVKDNNSVMGIMFEVGKRFTAMAGANVQIIDEYTGNLKRAAVHTRELNAVQTKAAKAEADRADKLKKLNETNKRSLELQLERRAVLLRSKGIDDDRIKAIQLEAKINSGLYKDKVAILALEKKHYLIMSKMNQEIKKRQDFLKETMELEKERALENEKRLLEGEQFQKDMHRQAEQAMIAHWNVMATIDEQNWQRRYKVTENIARFEQELNTEIAAQVMLKEKRKQEAINKTIEIVAMGADMALKMGDMFDIFGEASAKSEEERQKAMAKRALVENTIKAAVEIAESVAAFARYDFWGGAQHATAATLYAAAAGQAASSIGGGGGGGGGRGTNVSQFRETGGGEERREEKSAIVINVYGHQIFGRDSGRQFYEDTESWLDTQRPARTRGSFQTPDLRGRSL